MRAMLGWCRERSACASERQAPEMCHGIGMILQICVEKLDDDSALEMQVKGPPDLSHTTR